MFVYEDEVEGHRMFKREAKILLVMGGIDTGGWIVIHACFGLNVEGNGSFFIESSEHIKGMSAWREWAVDYPSFSF